MAVGMILTCSKCGKSYDEGKTIHYAYCDGGAAIKKAQKDFKKFMALPAPERWKYIFETLEELKEDVDNIPYNGPIG